MDHSLSFRLFFSSSFFVTVWSMLLIFTDSSSTYIWSIYLTVNAKYQNVWLTLVEATKGSYCSSWSHHF